MSKEIREIPYHLYLGSQFQMKMGNGEWSAPQILTTYTLHDIVSYYKSESRLLLRKLSSMTEEEAKGVLKKLLNTDDIIFAKANHLLAGCERLSDDEYEDFMQDDRDKLNYAEECDYTNVLSISVSDKSLAYGTGEEMRFFVEPHTYSKYLNELRKLSFDCDNLIPEGLALDSDSKQ